MLKINAATSIIITCSVIPVKCNMFLNKIAAKKNPIAVVVHKNVLILLNGLQASITAKILTPPIIKYIKVCASPVLNPKPSLENVNSTILIIMVKAYGIAFCITVLKKVPLKVSNFLRMIRRMMYILLLLNLLM